MKKLFFFAATLLASASLMAAEIPVTPGSAAISTAIAGASAGDVLVLSAGDYTEPEGTVTIDKALTIKAAVDAKPAVTMSGAKFSVSAGLTIEDISFIGVGWNNIIEISGGTGYEVVVDGCSFKNFSYGIKVSADAQLDKLTVNDCIFDTYSSHVIFAAKGSVAPGVIKNFTLSNSTIVNGNTAPAVKIFDNDEDASTEGPTVLIDHCTLYSNSTGDYCLYLRKIGTQATIKNCIVSNPTTGAPAPYYGYDNFNLVNCIWNNYATGYRTPASVTDSEAKDPLFMDAANGNFQLKKTSPAIGAGTDKSNLGDPRWGVEGPGTGMIEAAADMAAKKVMRDGKMMIMRDGKAYNVLGF